MVFIIFGSWGNHVSTVFLCCHSGTSSSSTEGHEPREVDPGASAGAEPVASEGPGDEGESEAPEGKGPAKPGTDFWLIVLFVFLFSSFVRHPLVSESLYHHLFNANTERSSTHIPVETPSELRGIMRAPLGDEDERDFLAW